MFGKSKGSRFCILNQTLTKKEQAWSDREDDLLDIAERIMEEEGFSGLTMDKLVALCEYSKGTVYNHFCSKEDLLCALCIKGMRLTLELFEKALAYEGSSRERILAVHFAYRLHTLTHPTLFLCVLTSQTPAVKEKASEHRLELQQELDSEMTHYCDFAFKQAIENQELSGSQQIEDLVFGSWALSFGCNALMTMASEVESIQRIDNETVLLNNINLLMDGMGWLPLSKDYDYQQTWHRLATNVFSAEIAKLNHRL